jgi:RHS repeat-associated protein
MSASTDWLGNTVSYSAYTALGQVGAISYPLGAAGTETMTYSYDLSGNLAKVTYGGPALTSVTGPPPVSSNAYSMNASNLIGSAGLVDGSTPTFAYDAGAQVVSGGTSTGSSPTASSTIQSTFSYNPNQTLASETPTGSSAITLTSNIGSRLKVLANPNTSTTTSFYYDNNGNRCGSSTTTTLTGCSSIPVGSMDYEYDALGHLCWMGPAPSGGASCSSPASGSNSAAMSYDGLGRLATSTSGGVTAKYCFDTQSSSVPRMLSDGTKDYVYGPAIFGGSAPVEQISGLGGSPTVSFLAVVPSGVQEVFGAASATIQEQAVYSVWGTQRIEVGSKVSNFGFDGAYSIPGTSGLLYLTNRFYDPSSYQFISMDPAFTKTWQAYAFAGNDPVNATDPLGLAWYCMQGTTQWYTGTAYTENGKCGFGDFGQYCYWGDSKCTSSARWETKDQASADLRQQSQRLNSLLGDTLTLISEAAREVKKTGFALSSEGMGLILDFTSSSGGFVEKAVNTLMTAAPAAVAGAFAGAICTGGELESGGAGIPPWVCSTGAAVMVSHGMEYVVPWVDRFLGWRSD